MTTTQFNRGISENFVKALNHEYEKGGWWRNLVDDSESFLAIRGGYVNVYYCGCSLLMLKLNGDRLEGSVDYKYLLQPDLENADRSIGVVNGKPALGRNMNRYFLDDFASVDRLKRAVEPYAGEEKKGVQKIIRNNPNVLDVEVAISNSGTAPRIDLAAMHKVNGQIEIKFYEAKCFSNPELRANKGRVPKVLGQVHTYGKLLKDQGTDIEDSYRKVCSNLVGIAGVAEKHPERHELLQDISRKSVELEIDAEPHLLIFGFTADQRDGRIWKPHRDRLRKELGHRVTMRRNPGRLPQGR